MELILNGWVEFVGLCLQGVELGRRYPLALGIALALLAVVLVGVGANRVEQAGLRRTLAVWRTWPTLVEYSERHPSCMTYNGVKCAHCQGHSLNNHSYAGTTLRVVSCNTCNKGLYRV